MSDEPGPATASGLFALIKIEEEPIGGCEQALIRRSIVSSLGYTTRQFGERFGPVPIR